MKKTPPVTAPKPYKLPGSTNAKQHYTGLPNYQPLVYKNPEDATNLNDLPSPPAELLQSCPNASNSSRYKASTIGTQLSHENSPAQHSQQLIPPFVSAAGNANGGQEAEVDKLTSLLLQSMNAASDPDFYGMCSICEQKVIGDKNGCTAMDKTYHVTCFICMGCGTALNDKPFFVSENKQRCETCYMTTLELCVKCSKHITDRLIRACGAPHHPDCFRCTSCSTLLDGVAFSLDPSGTQPHCVDCYNNRFGPRCSACSQPILPSPGQHESLRVVALERDFHISCFKCEDCGRPLSSEEEAAGCYPLDGHLLCKGCNATRIQRIG